MTVPPLFDTTWPPCAVMRLAGNRSIPEICGTTTGEGSAEGAREAGGEPGEGLTAASVVRGEAGGAEGERLDAGEAGLGAGGEAEVRGVRVLAAGDWQAANASIRQTERTLPGLCTCI